MTKCPRDAEQGPDQPRTPIDWLLIVGFVVVLCVDALDWVRKPFRRHGRKQF